MPNPDTLLVVFIPASHLDAVKAALFAVGAGTIDAYQACAWQTKGEGQFYATNDATPWTGAPDTLTKVEEYRVEMMLSKDIKALAETALLNTHPYEVPAYYFIDLAQSIS